MGHFYRGSTALTEVGLGGQPFKIQLMLIDLSHKKAFIALIGRSGPGFHRDKLQPEPRGFALSIRSGFRFSPE